MKLFISKLLNFMKFHKNFKNVKLLSQEMKFHKCWRRLRVNNNPSLHLSPRYHSAHVNTRSPLFFSNPLIFSLRKPNRRRSKKKLGSSLTGDEKTWRRRRPETFWLTYKGKIKKTGNKANKTNKTPLFDI